MKFENLCCFEKNGAKKIRHQRKFELKLHTFYALLTIFYCKVKWSQIPLLLPLLFERKYYFSLVTLRSSNSPQMSFSVKYTHYLTLCIIPHISTIIIKFGLLLSCALQNITVWSGKVVYFSEKKKSITFSFSGFSCSALFRMNMFLFVNIYCVILCAFIVPKLKAIYLLILIFHYPMGTKITYIFKVYS